MTDQRHYRVVATHVPEFGVSRMGSIDRHANADATRHAGQPTDAQKTQRWFDDWDSSGKDLWLLIMSPSNKFFVRVRDDGETVGQFDERYFMHSRCRNDPATAVW